MGTSPTKSADNIYCRCRKEAAKYNDKLNSRFGASELLGVSESSLADYELGITKVMPVDKVVLMSDLYNAPELKNYYCTHECPIGKTSVMQLEIAKLDRITLKILAAFKDVTNIKETLIDITADGVISNNEINNFSDVMASLNNIVQSAQELKLWAEKTIRKER